MAVTQISRIQVRRGRKYSPTGIPQLASGEIAWAVDSQELFIGNGSVAEGAPYVGNTKILTEHDNILSLVSAYQYKESDPAISKSVKRSLQSKLDEYVSVLDFGAVGDGIFDNSDAFESAFLDLYRDRGPGNDIYKKTLFVPAGRYIFLRSLRIPSNVILVGESKQTTSLLFLNNAGILFSIVNPDDGETFIDNPAQYTTEFPQNIQLSNISVAGSGGTGISASLDVLFDNINFIGTYTKADVYDWVPSASYRQDDVVRYRGQIYKAVVDIVAGSSVDIYDTEGWLPLSNPAVYWENGDTFKTDKIKFVDCVFGGHTTALYCDQTLAPAELVTAVTVESCHFENLDTGVYLESDPLTKKGQSNNWKFFNCNFKRTNSYAILSSIGKNTLIKECNFEDIGTNSLGVYLVPAVQFGQSQNNLVVDCTSDRQSVVNSENVVGVAYVPEVVGADRVNFLTTNVVPIQETDGAKTVAIFSSRNDYIDINYNIKLITGDIRTGTMKIRVNNNTLSNEKDLTFTDDYTHYTVPGQLLGAVPSSNLSKLIVSRVLFGRLFSGSMVYIVVDDGKKIVDDFKFEKGTRVVSGENIAETNQAGEYILNKPATEAIDEQLVYFTRDTVTNLVFGVKLTNNDDSTDVETIELEYYHLTTANSFPGDMTFNVSYGTLSV